MIKVTTNPAVDFAYAIFFFAIVCHDEMNRAGICYADRVDNMLSLLICIFCSSSKPETRLYLRIYE